MRYIVVTDLDGTLLDHQTYEFTPAMGAIAKLQQREIPLILNSSKTQAEISAIRQKLNNQEPFVCENGGVVCGLNSQSAYLGIPRHQFLDSLRVLKVKLGLKYQGFADATIADVVQWTGLTAVDAAPAMEREATEPLLWQDTELALIKFRAELEKIQLQCVKGGRFYHVMGTFNKASCFPKLKQYYKQYYFQFGQDDDEIEIIALGDSPNDLPMLEQADYAVVIPSAKGIKLKPDNEAVFFATQPAPYGWQEGIDFWLKTLFNI